MQSEAGPPETLKPYSQLRSSAADSRDEAPACYTGPWQRWQSPTGRMPGSPIQVPPSSHPPGQKGFLLSSASSLLRTGQPGGKLPWGLQSVEEERLGTWSGWERSAQTVQSVLRGQRDRAAELWSLEELELQARKGKHAVEVPS